ncbi:MAG TPA: hypothetical protein VFY23_09360 [Candidatus Limnocylindrales bacterium]|nr:hypothetical protein [Candidatus Limnocylindrales bacterium]
MPIPASACRSRSCCSTSSSRSCHATDRLAAFDLVGLGAFSAHLQAAQAALAVAVLASGTPTVTVALRTRWDLLAFPSATTHVCRYGMLPPTTEALARALVGEVPFEGRLPVGIPGLHERGHGLTGRA